MAEKNMSQPDLANTCGFSRQHISKILSSGNCYTKSASKLAKALGVSVSEIVYTEPDKTIEIAIQVDTSELDEALQKIDKLTAALMELQEKMKKTSLSFSDIDNDD